MFEKLIENIKDIKPYHVLVIIVCFCCYFIFTNLRDLVEGSKRMAKENYKLERKIDSINDLRIEEAYKHGVLKGKEEYINKIDSIWKVR